MVSVLKLNQKLKTPVCNPLIIAIVLTAGVLVIFDIRMNPTMWEEKIINMFLAPATACLAVAIYTKRTDPEGILAADPGRCSAGSAASMASVYVMCRPVRTG